MSFVDQPLRGFLIPDTRLTAANEVTADAAGDEASPRAGGIAEPDSSTARLALEVLGDQDADLVFQVEQGGHAQLGAGCRVSRRLASEASTARCGWNAPNIITGWTAADYSTTANTMLCSLALANGQILVAYRAGSTTAYFQTYTPDTNTWSGTIAFPDAVHATGSIALAQTPDGSVVAIYRGSGGQWRVKRYSVADAVSGGSWVAHGVDVLDNVPGTAGTRSRLLITPSGEWAFFYQYSGVLWQYASSSTGTQFVRIATATPTAATMFDACVTPSGKIIVCTFSGNLPYTYTIGAPGTPYTSATAVLPSGAAFNWDEAYFAADPNGRIYLYVKYATSPDQVSWWYSDNDGASWLSSNYDPIGNSDANTYLTNGQMVFAGGAVWWAHQFSDSVSTTLVASICLMKLGGFSSITIQGDAANTGITTQDRYRPSARSSVGSFVGKTWVPFALPDNHAPWTTTTSGTNAGTLTGGRYKIACTGAGGTRWHNPAAPGTRHVYGQFQMNCEIGGSSTAHQAGLLLRGNATSDYEVGIFVTTTSITVRDVIAGTTLGSATGLTMSNDTDVHVDWHPGSHLHVAYKRPQDSKWTEIVDTGATTGTAASTTYIRWGTSSSSVTTSSWRYFWFISDDPAYTYYASSAGATYANITGRLVTSLPAAIDMRSAYGRKQTYIRAKDGPGRVTDSFQARVRADYARENILWQQSPSPRTPYRNTSDASLVAFAWQPAAGVNTSYGSTMLAVMVLNTNAKTHVLSGDPDDGGGYDVLGTMDLSTGFSGLTYARTGNVIRINGGSSGSRYVWQGEFVGASVDLGGGKVRRIGRHTSGTWTTTGKQVELVLETTGDGAYDGTESASGTCSIIAHSGVLIIPNINASVYKKLKWSVAAQDCAGDYIQAGNVILGRVQVVGQEWDWGWAFEYSGPVQETETRPGATRRSLVGPIGRTLSLAWSEGVDISRLRDTSPPNHLSDNSGDTTGLAAEGDVPFLLAGLLNELRAGEVPVGVLPKVPTTATTITDPTLFLYGRLISPVRLAHVQGDEGTSEVYRAETVTVQEIT